MSNEPRMTLIGGLTADPEMRFVPSGTAVANFSIVNKPRVFNRAKGEWTDGDPLYMKCTAWDKTAEHITDSLKRGDRVIVTGRLRQRSFDTTDGDKRTVIELEVEEIGPTLRWTTVTVNRSSKNGSQQTGDDQPPF